MLEEPIRDTGDEWDVDHLDLPAYLRRISYDGDLRATAKTLAALHRAHVAAIPFENLDIRLGRGVSVDLDRVQAKLVDQRRGGYCYEHGLLFAAALQRLRYPVDRSLARVAIVDRRMRARSHFIVTVQAEGRLWLADVGFGSGLLEPVPLDAGGSVMQGGWTFKVSSCGPGCWQLLERQGDTWTPLYSFDDSPLHHSDVIVANHFSSTYPRAPFVTQVVVVQKDEVSVSRLLGRRFSISRADGSTHEQELTDHEVADTLRTHFNLTLAPDDLATLAKLTTADSTTVL